MRMISLEADLSNLIGRRVRLLHTDDPYTKLFYHHVGTIQTVATELSDIDDKISVLVRWDNGLYATLVTPGDLFAFVD